VVGLAALVFWGRRRTGARAAPNQAEARPGPDSIGSS
jgi:hypothetical protein